MQYRKLGETDIEVSAIAMGCWAVAGDRTWGRQDESDAIAAMQAALDVGINFFDTAPGYGNGYSENLLAKALADRREQVIIADKVSQEHLAPAALIASCEKSLMLLRTDHIDLLQIHWPDWDVPQADTFGAMLQLKEQGKIRAIGVSNFGPRDLGEAVTHAPIVTNQLVYSLLARSIEFEIKPLCRQHGVGILCYSPLAQGLLTGKFATADEVPVGRARTRHFSHEREQTRHGQSGCERETFEAIYRVRAIADSIGQSMADVAMAWLLAQSGVTSVLAGARNADQARRNAKASDLVLSQETLDQLDKVTQDLKAALGREADLWAPPSESRMR